MTRKEKSQQTNDAFATIVNYMVAELGWSKTKAFRTLVNAVHSGEQVGVNIK
jgi:hypothetical protein